MSTIYPVIMCGGAGTRLWPLSRKALPKQYHALTGEETMLAQTVLRVAPRPSSNLGMDIAPPSFVCAAGHNDIIQGQCRDIGITPHLSILEPMGRNTAAATAAIAQVFEQQDTDSLILLLPADHHIADIDGFWAAVTKGVPAARDGYLTTFGIAPTHPETGYGYIRTGASIGEDVSQIAEFKEKPDLAVAQKYLESGQFFWNAGIFLFTPAAMRAAFTAHAPDIYSDVAAAMAKGERSSDVQTFDPDAFAAVRSDSLDYAIMERSEKTAIVSPVDVGWNDIGSWSALRDANPGTHGDVIALDCKNSYIRSDGPLVTAVGLDNMIVVVSGDSVLIMPADRAQDVKLIVERLKTDDRSDKL